jgi:hypothetical protein
LLCFAAFCQKGLIPDQPAEIQLVYQRSISMAYKIAEFKGVTGHVAEVFKSLGIADAEQLLLVLTDPAQREALQNKLGVDDRFLREMGEQADLTRVKGIGPSYAELLTLAGVHSVADLRAANGTQLMNQLVKTSETFGVKRVPKPEEVAGWIEASQGAPNVADWAYQIRVDDLKGHFADDEWTRVRIAPLAVAALVMGASPSSGQAALDEFSAATDAIASTREGTTPWSLFNVAFGTDFTVDEMNKFMAETPRSAMLSVVKAAVANVAAKDPADALAYRNMLMNVANQVAGAAKEGGFLGMGAKQVSTEEQATLDELRAVIIG